MSDGKEYLKTMGLTGQAGSFGSDELFLKEQERRAGRAQLRLRFKPYTLHLKHAFNLATSSRTTTPIVLTELEYDGIVGYGEASMPPYLGESHESVLRFLSRLDLSQFDDPFQMETILDYVDHLEEGNRAAKASIDIALHDLVGKMVKLPWYRIWGYDAAKTPLTSYTIGIDTAEKIRQKVNEAEPFKILKVKLGAGTDKMMIETIREVTDKPLSVDVNQGWRDREEALDMAHWLHERGVIFIEQAMPKEQVDDNAWLTGRSPIPTIADEAVQRLDDVMKAYEVYSGINIKLMKCTGMREAHKILNLGKSLGMKIMIGCMTETSCAISAAAQLSPMVDWADLDGFLLIKDDLFDGTKIVDGKITLNDLPGIGIKRIQ